MNGIKFNSQGASLDNKIFENSELSFLSKKRLFPEFTMYIKHLLKNIS